MYARPIQKLIQAFSRLPSVGPRSAERFVLYLLKSGKQEVLELSRALDMLVKTIKSCSTCFDFSDISPCTICQDPQRNRTILCVVAEPNDVQAIERARVFSGRYHILRGTIDQTDPDVMKSLKIKELYGRLRNDSAITEVILAFNPDIAGESTILFLSRNIREIRPTISISRLARGLPLGSDLRYADDMTLGSALSHRTKAG